MLPVKQPLGIDQCNCFAIRKANRQVSRFYDAHLDPAGLRLTQFLTLAALHDIGRIAVNALAERLDIERTAMGKMIGFLERDGLVAIKPSPIDRRSRLVELTAAGQRLHDEAMPLWQTAQRQFEQLNGTRNISALRGALRHLVVGESPAVCETVNDAEAVSQCGHTAIHEQQGAGNVGRVVGSQE